MKVLNTEKQIIKFLRLHLHKSYYTRFVIKSPLHKISTLFPVKSDAKICLKTSADQIDNFRRSFTNEFLN